jgi:hypothetical protein
MRRWWRHWLWKREQRNFEVWLFNYGPVDKWRRVRDENTAQEVWKGWPL